jgi:hypothetical protein
MRFFLIRISPINLEPSDLFEIIIIQSRYVHDDLLHKEFNLNHAVS